MSDIAKEKVKHMKITEASEQKRLFFARDTNVSVKMILFFAFFLSGMSGLIFQIVWVRMLTRYLGSTTSATATVLCVFMGGLALGAFAGGKLSDRLKKPLIGYMILEIGIAVTALLVSFTLISIFGQIYLKIYEWIGNSGLYLTASRVLFSMLCLFFPTVLMGATLPLLVAHVTRRNDYFQQGLGRLYSINTFGAVLGVFVAGFILLGFFGETASLLIAAALNCLAALLASRLLMKIMPEDSQARQAENPKSNVEVPVGFSLRIRYWSRFAIFVSGFTALAYEILWSRFLMLPLKTSIYAFSFMLGLFLLGIACGSWLSTRYAVSNERPVSTFAVLEILIGFLTVLGMLLFTVFGKISNGFLTGHYLGLITALLMVFPVAMAFGWQFPVAVRCCLSDSYKPGRTTGWAYAANTLGAILGSVTAGFIWIPYLGTTNTMFLLAFLNIVLGGILLWIRPRAERRGQPVFSYALIAGFVVLCIMVTAPYKRVMFERVRQYLGANAQMYAFHEGIAGTVVPAGAPEDPMARHLFTNGVGMTVLISETKLMAHLPMAMAKDPKRILVVCFGMGTTLRSASRHPGVQVDIDAVDIVPNVFDCFKFFHKDADFIVKQPNIHLYADDGRNFLLLNQKTYDVITIDPAPPIYSAGTVNLYTREFLELCKSRINDTGVVSLWLPPAPASELMMIMKTFTNVFPGATLWGGLRMPGFYLIGGYRSFEQTPESLSTLVRRLSKISDLSEWDTFYQDEATLEKLYLLGPSALRGLVKNISEVTDDHPYTEFPLWRGVLTDKLPDLTASVIRRHLKQLRKAKLPNKSKSLNLVGRNF
jgi:spermidine synthase